MLDKVPTFGGEMSACSDGGLVPQFWEPRFGQYWAAFITEALKQWGTNKNVGYLRFGMGLGGQSNPTAQYNGTNPACEQELENDAGFTQQKWLTYMGTLSTAIASHRTTKKKMQRTVIETFSPLKSDDPDATVPDTEANEIAALGLGIGNQGLKDSDLFNTDAGKPCVGGDWCAIFAAHRGKAPLELQTMSYSDLSHTPVGGAHVTDLSTLLGLAIDQGAQILEIYPTDWYCTYVKEYEPPDSGFSTFSACQSHEYRKAFAAAAEAIN